MSHGSCGCVLGVFAVQ